MRREVQMKDVAVKDLRTVSRQNSCTMLMGLLYSPLEMNVHECKVKPAFFL